MTAQGEKIVKDMARLAELRGEIMEMANSYAGNVTGKIAVTLHWAANYLLDGIDQLNRRLS